MTGHRTRGCSWKLAAELRNSASFGIPDQWAFGGLFSWNHETREAETRAPPRTPRLDTIITPAPKKGGRHTKPEQPQPPTEPTLTLVPGCPFGFFGPPQSGSSRTRRNIGHNSRHRCNIMRSQVVKTRQLSTFCDAYAGSVR